MMQDLTDNDAAYHRGEKKDIGRGGLIQCEDMFDNGEKQSLLDGEYGFEEYESGCENAYVDH